MSYMTVGDTIVDKIGSGLSHRSIGRRRFHRGPGAQVSLSGVLEKIGQIGGAISSGITTYGQASKPPAEIPGGAPTDGGGTGFPVMPIVLLGGVGLVAYMLLKKK